MKKPCLGPKNLQVGGLSFARPACHGGWPTGCCGGWHCTVDLNGICCLADSTMFLIKKAMWGVLTPFSDILAYPLMVEMNLAMTDMS